MIESHKRAGLNLEIVKDHISVLKTQILAGDFNGSGTRRDGMRGDIEYLMGWEHNNPIPDLTQDLRIKYLTEIRAIAEENNDESDSAVSLIMWLDSRINEVTLSEVEDILKDMSAIPDDKKDKIEKVLEEVKKKEEQLVPYLGKEVRRGQSLPPEDELKRIGELIGEIETLKLRIYEISRSGNEF